MMAPKVEYEIELQVVKNKRDYTCLVSAIQDDNSVVPREKNIHFFVPSTLAALPPPSWPLLHTEQLWMQKGPNNFFISVYSDHSWFLNHNHPL